MAQYLIMMRVALLTGCLLMCLINRPVSSENHKNKPVITHLSAKWPSTPLLLETAEYMAEESPATFWTFVDDVATWDTHAYTASKNISLR